MLLEKSYKFVAVSQKYQSFKESETAPWSQLFSLWMVGGVSKKIKNQIRISHLFQIYMLIILHEIEYSPTGNWWQYPWNIWRSWVYQTDNNNSRSIIFHKFHIINKFRIHQKYTLDLHKINVIKVRSTVSPKVASLFPVVK